MVSKGPGSKSKKGRKGQSLSERGVAVADGRTVGRPKGSFLPKYDCDWEVAESYYVQGIIVEEKRNGIERRKPSYADVARRFSVSKASVAYHSKKRSWQNKREKYDDMEKSHIHNEVAKARSYSFAEGEAIIDRWIKRFDDGLEKGDVRADSLGDFERALRTKAFLRGQTEVRVEVKNTFTLETLQRAHAEQRERFEESDSVSSPVATGVLVEESNMGNNDPSLH